MAKLSSALIVDDTPQFQELLRRMLIGACGISDVIVADSLDAARQIIPTRVFDLIFVDYHFPAGVSGAELIAELKDNSALVFLVTSEPTPEKVKEVGKLGVAGVIAKPFDLNEVKKKVADAEHKRELFKQGGF